MEIIDIAVENRPQAALGTDPRSGLIFNGYIETNRAVALVQPTEWSQAGIELAARVLTTLHRTLSSLARASDLSVSDRIRRAFDAANADLLEHAAEESGHDSDARIGIGVNVVLVEGVVATIGLVPPAQILLWQDGRLTWCPVRESWTGQQPGLTGSPLGWSKEPQPTLVATSVNQRDELVLTTDVLAKQLAQSPTAELKSGDSLCARITALGSDQSADPTPLIAVSTRFIAPTVTGSLIWTTRHALVQIEERVRSAWIALRSHPGSGQNEAG